MIKILEIGEFNLTGSQLIGASQISESESEKLLGVALDSKLNFNLHVIQLCVKAS